LRWVIIIVVALVALIIAIFAAGAVLPRKHMASVMTRLSQPQQVVWLTINNHADDPKWRPDLKSIEKLPDRNGHPVWLETYKNDMKLELEDTMVDGPKQLVRQVHDQGNIFSGTWTIDVTANGDNACTVAITENGEVPNPFFRFMSRFVFGHTKGMEQYLVALASKFGEKPSLVIQP
jgi:hypothetical protein